MSREVNVRKLTDNNTQLLVFGQD